MILTGPVGDPVPYPNHPNHIHTQSIIPNSESLFLAQEGGQRTLRIEIGWLSVALVRMLTDQL